MVFRHYEASVPETVSLAIGPKGPAKLMRINSTAESILLWFNFIANIPKSKGSSPARSCCVAARASVAGVKQQRHRSDLAFGQKRWGNGTSPFQHPPYSQRTVSVLAKQSRIHSWVVLLPSV